LFLAVSCTFNYSRLVTYPSSHPLALAVADFNQDTRPDLVVVNYLSDSIGVLLGNGNGTFTSPTIYSTGSGSTPLGVAVADVNRDNRIDIVVVNYQLVNIGVLLGYGNGAFAAQVTYTTGSAPYSVAIGDFNNDTQPDLVVANAGGNSISILLGYGNGSFATQTIISTGSNSNSDFVAVADFNLDGRLDIAVSNHLNDNIGILLGVGNGTFAAQTTYSTGSGSNPNAIAIGDFNQDNRPDIVIVNGFVTYAGILLGLGNGLFTPQTQISTSSWATGVSAADLNADTHLDMVVSHYGTGTLGIFLGNGNGTFAAEILISASGTPYTVAIADFNNDNLLDMAVANSSPNTADIYLKKC
jgi:hypothetical protein